MSRPTRAALVAALVTLAACSSGSPRASTTTASTVEPATTTSPTTGATTTSTAARTTTSTHAPSALDCIARWPRRARVAQLVMLAVGSTPDAVAQTFASLGVGGAILQSSNGVSAASVARLRTAGHVPLLVGADEEGGPVQRFASLTGVLPSARTIATTQTSAQAQALVAAHARAVAALGINVVFAPVVDVLPASGVAPIGSRSFSSDPSVVTRYGRAYVDAWRSAGVLPVLKHFPGFGSATANTDQAPAVVPPLAQLRTRDLLPYETLARGDARLGVMVAHVDVPGFTHGPASLTSVTYALLRNEVGFPGLVFTDALDAGAITAHRTVASAAVAAVAASADVVLVMRVGEAQGVIDALHAAIGTTIPVARLDAAVLRILGAKHVDPCRIAP